MLGRMGASLLLSTTGVLGLAQAPKRIVWVRHGEVNSGLKSGAVYGGADVPLSENGEAEARAAAAMIQSGVTDDLPVAAVFCSPLARAVYGADVVAAACGLTLPTALSGFREVVAHDLSRLIHRAVRGVVKTTQDPDPPHRDSRLSSHRAVCGVVPHIRISPPLAPLAARHCRCCSPPEGSDVSACFPPTLVAPISDDADRRSRAATGTA